MSTPALPGLSATAWPGAAPADTTVHTDLLGTVRIPTDQIRAAILSGLNRRLLDDFFPIAASGGVRLGRGGSYYRPRTALPAATALARAVAALDERAPGDAPAVRHALLDNLYNLAAAGAYALWHDLTDRPAPPGDPRPAALERLIAAATTTAAHLHGLPAPGGPLTVPAGDLELLSRTDGGWRTFRELDNHTKIGNELAFLADHLLASRPEITTLLAPLYGSLSLAVAARTARPSSGRAPGAHRLPRPGLRLLPRHHRRCSAAAHRARPLPAAAGRRRGWGNRPGRRRQRGIRRYVTRRRQLAEQLGGRAVTRSVESAWTLYHRAGRHDIADAADLPNLRPNLHHSIHTRLIGHLLRGDGRAYAGDPAHRACGTLRQQMADSFDLAVSTGTWSGGQLTAMRAELAHAAAWTEPPIPRPAALVAAA